MEPWKVEASEYPSGATRIERLRFLVRYAVLAPSGHNTQPWRFRVHEEGVDLLADRSRALPVVDPVDRAMVISCGAALRNLQIAAELFGVGSIVDPFPFAHDADCLARLRVVSEGAPSGDQRLLRAILDRRTTRRPFESGSVPTELMEGTRSEVAEMGVNVRWVIGADERSRVAELVAEGDRVQMSDPRFRRELAFWIRSRRSPTRDGLSGYAFGMPDIVSPIGSLIIRAVDMGNRQAAKDRTMTAESPALVLFWTGGDDRIDWLSTGQAMQQTLLRLTLSGLTSSYLNQPIEVASLRPRLAGLLGVNGSPQILMRVGFGPRVLPAARRPIEDVIEVV